MLQGSVKQPMVFTEHSSELCPVWVQAVLRQAGCRPCSGSMGTGHALAVPCPGGMGAGHALAVWVQAMPWQYWCRPCPGSIGAGHALAVWVQAMPWQAGCRPCPGRLEAVQHGFDRERQTRSRGTSWNLKTKALMGSLQPTRALAASLHEVTSHA